MDDASQTGAADAAPLDPLTARPHELMRMLLPAARKHYVKAWELLADASVAPERRRLARDRVRAIADDHTAVVEFLRERESQFTGEDLRNARHLAEELERHVEALDKLATISPLGLKESDSLRPDALGCGKRYRVPAPPETAAGSGSRLARSGASAPTPKPRDPRDQRRQDRPFSDRGPKVPRDALGTSKHPSTVGDSLDETTRARLEEMRRQLDS